MALPSRCVSSSGTGSGWSYSLAWKLGFSSRPFLEVVPGRLCSGPAGLLLVTPFLQGHRGLVPATILGIHTLAETLVVPRVTLNGHQNCRSSSMGLENFLF